MIRQQRLTAYQRQIDRLSQHIAALDARTDRIADWRLLVALGGGGLAFCLLFLPLHPIIFWCVLITTGISFVALVNAHRQVEATLQQYRIWQQIKRENLARMCLDWAHIPTPHLTASPTALEIDLDLRELHRLLNTASSQAGTHRLHQWLLHDDPYQQTIEQRQKLVSELKDHPTFRDKLSLLSRLSSVQIRGALRTAWLQDWFQAAIPQQQLNRWFMILGVLAVANVLAAILAQMGVISVNVVGTLWGLYAVLYISRAGFLLTINQESQQVYELLSRIQAVMAYLEQYPYTQMPQTRKLCKPLREARPSQHIRRIMGTLAASNLRGNPIVWILLNALMPWDLYFLRRLQTQKSQLAHHMPQWFDVWHEIEALNSLATFADLNPDATMPHLNEATVLTAHHIGHPLIPYDKRHNNDFTVDALGHVAILTGSNMSGKSSFLRTLGVNLVMAYAGGVVMADYLDVRLFRLFTCIRVTDSLDDGISYFYAEVRRLRALLDALQQTHALPLFFVIDEIFRGTNNRERLIGSQAYVNALVGGHGIGLIATHDLELTQLATADARVRNLHFREHIQDGRMVFDYVLREGASPTTNALSIMAMEGLPISDSDQR